MMKNNKTLPTIAIVTVAVAALFASATIASYNTNDVFAKKKYGDSNAQTSAANNDCPADVFSFLIGIQLQASANCLNDINSVQDSDGAAISSAPANAAPSQTLDIELDFGVEQVPGATPTVTICNFGVMPPETQHVTPEEFVRLVQEGVPIQPGSCPATD